MKKFLVSILALVYLSSSLGATIHLHYCMGKLKGWDFFQAASNKCGSCDMEKTASKGCCHDEQKQLHAEQDQQLSAAVQLIITNPVGIIHSYHISPLQRPVATVENYAGTLVPPGPGKVPIFVRNRNFRI